MRIAHCQFEPQSGDFETNLAKMVEGAKQAEAERAEIVSFPETTWPERSRTASISCGGTT